MCGDTITFELLGRRDFDFIKFLGTTLRQEEFERVATELEEYIVDFRGEVREVKEADELKGEITLKIVGTPKLQKMKNPEGFISNEISQRLFVTSSKTIEDMVSKEIYLPLKIQFVDNFEYQNKPIKLKRTL
ncbi:hypothetical protein HQ403_01920 [Candidatus Kaiserbacteria bacterium]|nr:hypothetical protein [Candidatus Kaiserbacteria bacterium]